MFGIYFDGVWWRAVLLDDSSKAILTTTGYESKEAAMEAVFNAREVIQVAYIRARNASSN